MAPLKRLRPATAATGFATMLALLLCGAPARAAGLYLPAGDGALRGDVTLLIDAGVLVLSANAWPLPRAELQRALDAANPEPESPYATVLARVRRAAAGEPSGTFRARFAAGRAALLRDFDTPAREDGTASLSAAFDGRFGSATLVAAGVTDPADHHTVRLDGSELTLRAGNWLLGANLLDRWWGPGQQSSLILSNNARPLPALMLDRATALAPGWRVLHWIGPWRFTALAGQAEGSRQDVQRPYFMGMRFEMSPSPWVDFAAQRTALFCGSGRQCGLGTVWKMLVGHDNRGINTTAAAEPGDGLAGFDLRVKLPGPLPAAVYTQWIGEDVHKYLPVKYLGLFGVEAGHVSASGASLRGYVEYSDTTCAFNTTMSGGPQRHFNCAYNSGIYNVEGYRYYERSIGHTTDNDARLWVVGLRSAPAAGGEWRAKIVAGTLNRDNTDPLQPAPTNTVAALATQYRAAELGWQNDTFLGHIGLQLGVERLRPVGQSASDRAYGFLSWERGL
jgi:hypothetical protein